MSKPFSFPTEALGHKILPATAGVKRAVLKWKDCHEFLCFERLPFHSTDNHNGMSIELLRLLSQALLNNKKGWCCNKTRQFQQGFHHQHFLPSSLVGGFQKWSSCSGPSLQTTRINPKLSFTLYLTAFRWQKCPNKKTDKGGGWTSRGFSHNFTLKQGWSYAAYIGARHCELDE